MVGMKDIKNNITMTVPNHENAIKYMEQTDYQVLPLHLRWDKERMKELVEVEYGSIMKMAIAKTGKPSTKKETLNVYNTYRRALERGSGMLDTFLEIAELLLWYPSDLAKEVNVKPYGGE
jgi:hypothetical protein